MKNKIISFLCLLLLGTAVWWMSASVVWLGDDLDYKYMMKGEIWQSWGWICGVSEFFRSQCVHYLHVNGRFVAHALVQLFNGVLGQRAFALCNAAVYVLFAIMLCRSGKVCVSKNAAGVITAVCLSVLCFVTKMMPTCQIGYIWGMLVNLIWLSLFFRKSRPTWVTVVVMSLFGVIVGNWQESVSLGVCAGVGFWWISGFIRCRKHADVNFDWRRSWILAGYVVGTASNCLAPSTIGRTGGLDVAPFDQLLIASYSVPAVLLLIIAIIAVRPSSVSQDIFSFRNKDSGIPDGVLAIAMLALLVFNVAIGVYSNRQLFGCNLFAAILFLRVLPKHRLPAALNVLAAIAVMAFWVLMIDGTAKVRKQYDRIGELHSESSDGGVCFDRTRVMTLGFPLRAKYYEDILGQFDNDLHHSLMKDFKHERKGKTLKLKPTAKLNSEKVEKFAPGHFNVTLKEPPKGAAPREVILFGHYFGSLIKAAPRKLEVTRYSKRQSPYATAVIIPEYPFFTADSIVIVPLRTE